MSQNDLKVFSYICFILMLATGIKSMFLVKDEPVLSKVLFRLSMICGFLAVLTKPVSLT